MSRDKKRRRHAKCTKTKLEQAGKKYKEKPRKFYKHCKIIKWGYIPSTQFAEDEKEEMITSQEQIAEKFKEYFEKLFNNRYVNNEKDKYGNIVHYKVEPKVRTLHWDEI